MKEGNEAFVQSAYRVFSNAEVAAKWDSCASSYQKVDCCMQTGYYTLASMLRLPTAQSILEVGCGTGLLLHYAILAKQEGCSYLATDISAEMVRLAQEKLAQRINKFGVSCPLSKWLEMQKTQFLVHDCEKPFPFERKFDRIICNLTLHLTENPQTMLGNLAAHAEKGGLLGVSILGNSELSPVFSAPKAVSESMGIAETGYRPFTHLYNRVEELAGRTGWEVVMRWEQGLPYAFLQPGQELREYLQKVINTPNEILEGVYSLLAAELSQKRALVFPGQFYILRKQ